MVNLMLCRHPSTKYKLVAWAIDCKHGHEQGFILMKCCSYCGSIIKTQ